MQMKGLRRRPAGMLKRLRRLVVLLLLLSVTGSLIEQNYVAGMLVSGMRNSAP